MRDRTGRELQQRLRAKVLADAEPQICRDLKVALLLRAGGFSRAEIANRIGCSEDEVRASIERLREVVPEPDTGE